MEDDTGRLKVPVSAEIRRMLLEPPPPGRPGWKTELDGVSLVDLAHVVMLVERGIVDRAAGAGLLAAVVDLRRRDYAPLDGRPMARGVYLAYEHHLIERLGEGTGGVLHTARSRNDLNATCLKIRLRDPCQALLSGLVRLGVVTLNRARRYQEVVMPAYTHSQAAVPITYGHYLLGLCAALSRDARALLQAAEALRECPLGAGAVGGTTLPIDPARTARLLGFAAPSLNSVDAVASRDVVLRLLAASATLGTTLDRAARDLLLWSTAEFDMVTVPDHLVGSSSMMPQKRNAFVLEHVQGKTAAALGGFVAAVAGVRGTSFTNSISAGTEAVSHVWQALDETTRAVIILRMAVSGTTPNSEAGLRRARAGLTTATAIAERLAGSGMPFRRAHHEVGAAVRAVLEERGGSLVEAVAARVGDATPLSAQLDDPGAVRAQTDYGAGPGPRSFAYGLGELRARWQDIRTELGEGSRWRREAGKRLSHAVTEICGIADPLATHPYQAAEEREAHDDV
ncbi:argininosuccinate lyase [Streptosporangium sp. NPDC001681]|uniref:argininosuccinate lyase n=1 Tax=Streptosporangium sp. NPDC001681 TaxID=3154395 RepID=UPI00332DD414